MCRLLLIVLLISSSASGQTSRFQFTENKMGSTFQIIFYHADSAEASQVAKESFDLIDSLNITFSDFDTNSEISQLAVHAGKHPQKISQALFDVMLLSVEANQKSQKTFSVFAGALTNLWRNARRENKFPDKKLVRKARHLSSKNYFKFFAHDSLVLVLAKGASMDFGGIVKGYTAQKVIDHLHTKNIHHALVDAGGDIVMSKPPPGKEGWSVAVNLPGDDVELSEHRLLLSNKAIATSGNMYQFIQHDGKKYSHIINPKTGYGITVQRQVTVIANDGATADWLATACSILPISKALKLAESENASLLILEISGGVISAHRSATFNRYFF